MMEVLEVESVEKGRMFVALLSLVFQEFRPSCQRVTHTMAQTKRMHTMYQKCETSIKQSLFERILRPKVNVISFLNKSNF